MICGKFTQFFENSTTNISSNICIPQSMYEYNLHDISNYSQYDFPTTLKFNRNVMTNHTKYESIPQIVCLNRFLCPQTIQCNMKQDLVSNYIPYWKCNSSNGCIYYEYYYKNNISYINPESFHFREKGTPALKVKNHFNGKKVNKESIIERVLRTIITFLETVLDILIIILGLIVGILIVTGCSTLLGEYGICSIISGIIGFMISCIFYNDNIEEYMWYATLIEPDN